MLRVTSDADQLPLFNPCRPIGHAAVTWVFRVKQSGVSCFSTESAVRCEFGARRLGDFLPHLFQDQAGISPMKVVTCQVDPQLWMLA